MIKLNTFRCPFITNTTPNIRSSKYPISSKKPNTDNCFALNLEVSWLVSPNFFVLAVSSLSKLLLLEKLFNTGIPLTYSTNKLTISKRAELFLFSIFSDFLIVIIKNARATGMDTAIISASFISILARPINTTAAIKKSPNILDHICPTTRDILSTSL